VDLNLFAEDFYLLLDTNIDVLPKKISRAVPYMIEHNWLVSYASIEGLREILKQMNNKTKHETTLQKGVDIYIDHQKEFEDEFESFFKDIRVFCKEKIKSINQNL